MKKLFYFLFLFCINISTLFASDIVVNVVPNPVQLNQSARVSLVSEFDVDQAVLVIDSQEFILKKITNKLHRLNIVATKKMQNKTAFIKVFKTNTNFFKLPVSFQIITQKAKKDAYAVIDSKDVSILDIDNSQIEIDRLQDKVDLIDQRNQKLEDKIKNLEDQIVNQEELDLSRRDVKERQQQLDLLKERLEAQEIQRNNSISKLEKKIVDYEKMQEGLEKKESILSQMEDDLSQKSNQLSVEEMRLAGEKVVIEEKNILLKKKKTDLKNKTIALSQLKNEVSKQQKELKKRSVNIKLKKKKITAQEVKLTKREVALSSQKKKLTSMSSEISEKRKKLVALNLDIDAKRERVEGEKKRFYLDKKKKERVISQQQNYLKSLETKMIESLNSLSELEKSHLDKQAAIMLESQKVENAKELLETDKVAFSYEKKAIKELELELSVRIEMMKKLGVYIDSKLDELKQQFVNNKDYQNRYETDMEKKVDHIDNLTRLIEKRASRMEHLNYKLMEKNERLKSELKDTLSPDYRFAFSPYLGLRINEDDRQIYDSKEVGVRLLAFAGTRFHFASGVGLYNYIERQNDGSTASGRSTTFSLDMGYLFNPMEKIGVYLSTGISGDLLSNVLPTHVSAGLDFKYKTKKNLNTFLGVSLADAAMVRFGLETHLVSTKKDPSYYAHGRESSINSMDDDVIDNKENIFVTMNDLNSSYVFYNKPILFTDIKKSWYSKSVKSINDLGVYSLNNHETQFRPNENLSFKNASYLLSWMYDIDELLILDPVDISFSLFSDLHETVQVSVYVKDENGTVVDTLYEKEKLYVGSHSLTWDASRSPRHLNPGTYYVYLDIFSNEVLRSKKEYSVEASLINSVVKPFEIKGVSSYKEFLSLNGEPDDVSYVRKALENDWIEFNSNATNNTVTRIDFIVAVSKLLVESGALYRPINVDFTPYKDWSLVPLSKKRFLTTYVLELGYGGDSLSKLNPNDLITNAQAAVILDRFFQWKKQKLKTSNKYFNVKSVAFKQ